MNTITKPTSKHKIEDQDDAVAKIARSVEHRRTRLEALVYYHLLKKLVQSPAGKARVKLIRQTVGDHLIAAMQIPPLLRALKNDKEREEALNFLYPRAPDRRDLLKDERKSIVLEFQSELRQRLVRRMNTYDKKQQAVEKQERSVVKKLSAAASSLRDAFASFDTNRDGTVDKKEFTTGLQKMHLNLSSADIEFLWHRADTDGSGSVNYIEFARRYGEMYAKEEAEEEQQYQDIDTEQVRATATGLLRLKIE